MKRFFVFMVVFLSMSLCISNANSFSEERKYFELFSNCRPVNLLVDGEGPLSKILGGGWSQEAQKIGLTPESVRNVAESRLRAARIYGDDIFGPLLHITVNVDQIRSKSGGTLGRIFFVQVRLFKSVVDYNQYLRIMRTGKTEGLPKKGWGLATTWERNTYGTLGRHDKDPGFILSYVSRFLDEFLVEFLRVNNDEQCQKK